MLVQKREKRKRGFPWLTLCLGRGGCSGASVLSVQREKGKRWPNALFDFEEGGIRAAAPAIFGEGGTLEASHPPATDTKKEKKGAFYFNSKGEERREYSR